ncbi:MAG: FAD:protein FMN transferase [Pseudomonadales bacterium]
MNSFRIVTLIFLAVFANPLRAEWFQQADQAMGTEVFVQLWAENAVSAEKAIKAVLSEMHRVDREFSPYKSDSQLSKLNFAAYSRAIEVSSEMLYLLDKSERVSELSDGAFDITFATIGKFYNYRTGVKPSDREIAALDSAVNYRLVELDRKAGTVRFARPEIAIDLGGIAKGHAVDRGIEILNSLGIEHAMVSAGGDSKLLGDKRGKPWITAIRDPRAEGTSLLLPLENTAISTSGDYERFFLDRETGERHHHILVPQTGKSASTVQSVTIIGEDSTTCDALSTTVFVLGTEAGLELINRLPGIDAVIIDEQGLLHYSEDLLQAAPASDS